MPFLPDLTVSDQSLLMTTTFLGYHHALSISDGEFFDMQNMSGLHSPVASTRERRGLIMTLTAPHGIKIKDAMAWIDGTKLYYAGMEVPGITLSEDVSMLPKQMVSMGAYLCIWPDKVYVNTANVTDVGSMEAETTTPQGASVTYQMCRADGTDYNDADITVSASAPENPTNGQMWIDASQSVHVLKQYSSQTGEWSQVSTTFVKISCTGIGTPFSLYDGVTISGCTDENTNGTRNTAQVAQIAALNGDKIVYGSDENYLIIAGFVDKSVTSVTPVTVSRTVPDCDFITESENRLWGCKYGMAGGVPVNEIYACKLGDFKNWHCYLGLSTDSYAVSVGTDGRFTGAGTLSGNPVFFKEDCLHRISGSMPKYYQVSTTMCRGVERGSEASLCVVNEALFYKSASGICRYDGSLPVFVSDALGNVRYRNAVAGATLGRYYISMQDDAGAWSMFVLDTSTGLWFREDSTHALSFDSDGEDLYYLDADSKALMSVCGTSGTQEGALPWMLETGDFGFAYQDRSYLSRYNIRAQLTQGSSMKMEIQYDSDGVWRDVGNVQGTSTKTFMIPVVPRRCDHCRIRLSGTGDMKLFSIGRIFEQGGDG